jgi:HEAT repeat protein
MAQRPSPALSQIPTASQPNASSSPSPWLWWVALLCLPLAVLGGVLYGMRIAAPKQSNHQSNHQSKSASPEAISHPDAVSATVAGKLDAAIDSPIHSPIHAPSNLPDALPEASSLVTVGQSMLPLAETTRLARVDIVETLITDLRSLEPGDRRQAIWELGQRGDSRAIQPLVDLLMDADSQQRSLILAALSEIGTRTLKPMNRALMMSIQDDSPEVRKNAIRDVTRLCDVVAQISQLLQYAASDSDTEVRDTAQWALSQLDRIRSLPDSKD